MIAFYGFLKRMNTQKINLKEETSSLGIDPNRLIFAENLAAMP